MRNPGAILVAEADHAVADLITEVLRDDGYTVAIAYDRSTTLAAAAAQRPALVLLDEHIPSLGAAALQAHIAGRHRVSVPIITTTTHPAGPIALASRDSWACLAKPFSLDVLIAHVTHYVPRERSAAS